MRTFQGIQLHTQDYRGPSVSTRRKVVVVGDGASARVHVADIAPHASSVTWLSRNEVRWDHDIDRSELAKHMVSRVHSGRVPHTHTGESDPLLAARLTTTTRKRHARPHGLIRSVRPDGVVDDQGKLHKADIIVWATGFRPELRHLQPLRLRSSRGGLTLRGTRVHGHHLHMLGYGPSALPWLVNDSADQAVSAVLRDLQLV